MTRSWILLAAAVCALMPLAGCAPEPDAQDAQDAATGEPNPVEDAASDVSLVTELRAADGMDAATDGASTLYLAAANRIDAYDLTSGQPQWSWELPHTVHRVAVQEGRTYALFEDGDGAFNSLAVRQADSSVQIFTDVCVSLCEIWPIDAGRVLVGNSPTIASVDLETGAVSEPQTFAAIVYGDFGIARQADSIYLPGAYPGSIAELHVETLEVLATADLSDWLHDVKLIGDARAVAAGHELSVVNHETGEVLHPVEEAEGRRFRLHGSRSGTVLAVTHDELLEVDENGAVVARTDVPERHHKDVSFQSPRIVHASDDQVMIFTPAVGITSLQR